VDHLLNIIFLPAQTGCQVTPTPFVTYLTMECCSSDDSSQFPYPTYFVRENQWNKVPHCRCLCYWSCACGHCNEVWVLDTQCCL